MCRNIKTLFHFDPPATEQEVRDAALQFVRKLSGYTVPSTENTVVFAEAVEKISLDAKILLDSLHTKAPYRNREIEIQKARARSRDRFAKKV